MAEPRPKTPAEEAAFVRIPQYNTGPYDPTGNEFGFDEDGHQVNQIRQAGDVAAVGRYAGDMAAAAFDSAGSAAFDSARAAEDRGAVTLAAGQVAEDAARAVAAADSVNGAAIAARFDAVEARQRRAPSIHLAYSFRR